MDSNNLLKWVSHNWHPPRLVFDSTIRTVTYGSCLIPRKTSTVRQVFFRSLLDIPILSGPSSPFLEELTWNACPGLCFQKISSSRSQHDFSECRHIYIPHGGARNIREQKLRFYTLEGLCLVCQGDPFFEVGSDIQACVTLI